MSDVETTLRGPEAYKIASRALELMERHQVWPTALNFELWTHYVADPDGALARELTRLISLGEPMTELVSEELAAHFLPKARLNEQIRDAGDILSKELEAVSKAIQNAQKTNAAFGKQLAGASKSLDGRPTSKPSRPWSPASPRPPAACTRKTSRWKRAWPTPPPRSSACASTWNRSAATPPPTA
jgi:hypothetical protein